MEKKEWLNKNSIIFVWLVITKNLWAMHPFIQEKFLRQINDRLPTSQPNYPLSSKGAMNIANTGFSIDRQFESDRDLSKELEQYKEIIVWLNMLPESPMRNRDICIANLRLINCSLRFSCDEIQRRNCAAFSIMKSYPELSEEDALMIVSGYFLKHDRNDLIFIYLYKKLIAICNRFAKENPIYKLCKEQLLKVEDASVLQTNRMMKS